MTQTIQTLTPESHRSRKARLTHDKLAKCAVDLFLLNGFENTSVDEIAEGAGVSRRTFFHYFESKLAVLKAVEEGTEDEFRFEFGLLPQDRSPADLVELALVGTINRYYENQDAVAIDHLMRSTQTLRAQRQANFESRERALAKVLHERFPNHGNSQGLMMIAVAAIGALRLSIESWNDAAHDRPLESYFRDAMTALRKEILA